MEFLSLSDQVAIVTGAASGIGAAIAQCLAATGASIAVADRDTDKAQSVAQEIESSGGVGLAVHLDVTDWEGCVAAADHIADKIGRPSIVVNAAGVWTVRPFLELEPQDWLPDLEVSLTGTIQVTRVFAPAMVKAGFGSVVNITSDVGRLGAQRAAVYAAAKAGVIGFTKAVALELGPTGVRSNCVSPGATETPGAEPILSSWSEQRITRDFPLGRLGQPMDIANAVLFLASDRASWITGQVLSVNGGKAAFG